MYAFLKVFIICLPNLMNYFVILIEVRPHTAETEIENKHYPVIVRNMTITLRNNG